MKRDSEVGEEEVYRECVLGRGLAMGECFVYVEKRILKNWVIYRF